MAEAVLDAFGEYGEPVAADLVRVHGQRNDVSMTVVVLPDGRTWSAWPDAGSPGVVKNPTEKP